jgi:ATP-dependent Clp protease ATP-binding subunit ClpA
MARAKSLEEKAKFRLLQEIKIVNRECPNLYESGRNLTALYLTGKLDEVYNRDSCVESIQRILLRKSKANALLTGPAGCGKTAIAEVLAIACTEKALAYKVEKEKLQKAYEKAHKEWSESLEGNEPQWIEPKRPPLANYIVYDLSMNSLIGGTQYRGQFEERINNMLKELNGDKRIVLFIDEIHQMNSLGGRKNEGEPTLGQILKPALARGDIIVIGATTDEEAPLLLKDKALARRFTQVNVSELKGEGAKKTANGIFADYLKAHEIKADTALADAILQMINYYLPKTTFPDNFINVVDETLAGARYDELKEVNLDHFKATISRMAGVVIV